MLAADVADLSARHFQSDIRQMLIGRLPSGAGANMPSSLLPVWAPLLLVGRRWGQKPWRPNLNACGFVHKMNGAS